MKAFNFISSLVFLFLFSTAVNAQFNAQLDLTNAKECMERQKSGVQVVMIDANKPKNYQANHIKGAINIDHNELYQDGDIKGLIKSPEELAAYFGAKGISETSEVVIYDDGSQKYSTRIYWILKYIGAQHVKILHKDVEQCRAARVTMTAEATTLKPVTFTPVAHPEFFATIDEVKAGMDKPEFKLIDCRAADEFNGVKDSEGHIPGAINLNYEDLLTETGAFKSAEELKTIADKNGITPDKELILYCKTSVRAAVAFVAFRNILGYEKVKVYDGAYNEWIATNPVVQ